MGVPYQSWGSDLFKEGIFQPKGEQKSFLVWLAWIWASKRQLSRIEAKKKKVISTSGMGMQKVVGALHIAKEIWEPTQLGRLWTLVQTGSLCDTSSHFKIDVKGLWPGGGCKVAEDTVPMAGSEIYQMFALWHQWDSPSPHHLVEAWTSSESSEEYPVPSPPQCPSSALYWEKLIWTSSQDGGIGRYASLPCTTKRRTATNLKTKSNWNCQKIELYGSLTTKELKKKHSSILVGGAEMGTLGREDPRQGGRPSRWGSGWQTGQSHIHVCISQEEQLGNKTDHETQGSGVEK